MQHNIQLLYIRFANICGFAFPKTDSNNLFLPDYKIKGEVKIYNI